MTFSSGICIGAVAMLVVAVPIEWFVARLLRRAWARNDSYSEMVESLCAQLDAAEPYILIGRARKAALDRASAKKREARK